MKRGENEGHEKKEAKSLLEKSILNELTEQERREVKDLEQYVKGINTQYVSMGDEAMLKRLPQVVQSISNYLKTNTMLSMPYEEALKCIRVDEDQFMQGLRETVKAVKQYNIQTDDDFIEWRKGNSSIERVEANGKLIRVEPRPGSEMSQEKNCKEIQYPENKVIKTNPAIDSIIEYTKRTTIEIINLMYSLDICFRVSIPERKEGSNFGVNVQCTFVESVDACIADCLTIQTALTEYYKTRAKAIEVVFAHMEMEDAFQRLLYVDEEVYIALKGILVDLRNNCIILYDYIVKNYELLKNPRHEVNTFY